MLKPIANRNVEARAAIACFKSSIIDGIGLTANHGTPEEFDAYQRAQIKAVAELVASIGIKPE